MITPRWLGEPTDYLEIRDWPIEEWTNCDLAKEINYFLANLVRVGGAFSAEKKKFRMPADGSTSGLDVMVMVFGIFSRIL